MVLVAAACAGAPNVAHTSAAPGAAAATWTFDGDAAGALPSGAEPYSGRWTVRAEADAPSQPNALCQVGEADFPALALSGVVYGDVTVTLRFKAVSGRVDQAAGIVFRVQDRDNYYILRANALESNVNLYKYAAGRRTTIKAGTVPVAAGQWHELRVDVAGERLTGYLNGRAIVEATDATFRAGRVGLWTKADSVTCFDDVTVTPLPPGRSAPRRRRGLLPRRVAEGAPLPDHRP